MSIIRKSLTLLVLAALPVLASAQDIPQRLELVQIEREIDSFSIEMLEPVCVTYRKPVLTKSLEFTVQRDTYSRSAQMQKSDFDALVRGVKFYQRLHPNE